MTNEQRHFTRIPFNASATIVSSRTGNKTIAKLIDISFKGLLINKPDDWQGSNNEHYTVNLQLSGHEIEMNLEVIEVHEENNHIGFKTEYMDIDTATNLRRLVELNLGNESLLDRELSELVHSG
ncbi:MAG: PilZ domain-containing protein [Gammaproteobacteria bacterium]|nr:PilZ domain-containing protein [Gammaproteobacteria bacterium]